MCKEDCGSENVKKISLDSEKWQGRRGLGKTLGVAN